MARLLRREVFGNHHVGNYWELVDPTVSVYSVQVLGEVESSD